MRHDLEKLIREAGEIRDRIDALMKILQDYRILLAQEILVFYGDVETAQKELEMGFKEVEMVATGLTPVTFNLAVNVCRRILQSNTSEPDRPGKRPKKGLAFSPAPRYNAPSAEPGPSSEVPQRRSAPMAKKAIEIYEIYVNGWMEAAVTAGDKEEAEHLYWTHSATDEMLELRSKGQARVVVELQNKVGQ